MSPRSQVDSSSGVEILVGIGSSAGGLEALQELLTGLVPGSGTSYVVAQHLSPEHPSVLVDLLGRTTSLRVVAAVDGQVIRRDEVAIVPPNRDVTVSGNRLSVTDPAPRRGPSPGIDLLFESIARDWGPRGVGIILSGTGSDGSHGLRAIKAADGLAIAQLPESAKFAAMPRAAISLGAVDLVGDPTTIAARLRGLRGDREDWFTNAVPDGPADEVTAVIALLRRGTGVDFTGYKESTLRRQVTRRMAVRQVPDVNGYVDVLATDPAEAGALMANLLVTVTSFFRDPAAFDALRDRLQVYVDARESDEPVRVWVPGCATGEEVYTLAMIFAEVWRLDHPSDLAGRLRIFGTDLDESSLARARRAVFPLSSLEKIPVSLRGAYLVVGETEFEIAPGLRECTVFARHNLIEDPPFPRMDVVSCRNTLIYFTAALQDRALAGIRYALRPGGLLFLGALETIGPATEGFAAVDHQNKIFFRTGAPAPAFAPSGRAAAWTPIPPPRPASKLSPVPDSARDARIELLEQLVGTAGNPCLVVDLNHDLVEIVGDVSPYCRMRPGQASPAAESFLHPDLLAEARALLLLARVDNAPAAGRSIQLDGSGTAVRLEARPMIVAGKALIVLWFIPATANNIAPARDIDREAAFDAELERLERELLAGQDTWARSLAERETTYEELQASTEELQGASEELQASYEELETANEELEAVNEELGGVNRQLRERGDEFQSLNTDLENIQASLSQGMVLVDVNLAVTRFTPLAVRVFALLDADIGSPLLSVPTTLPLPGLADALHAVVRGAPRISLELTGDGVSYLAQVLPYEDADGQAQGAMVTMTDVTELVTLRREAQEALSDLSRITAALHEVVWKQNADTGQLLYVGGQVLALTGWTPEELSRQPGALNSCIDPHDREMVQAVRADTGGDFGSWTLEYRMTTRDGAQRWVRESASLIDDARGRLVVGTLSDITEERAAEDRAANLSSDLQRLNTSLKRSNDDLAQFASLASHDLQAPLRTVSGFAELLLNADSKNTLNGDQIQLATQLKEGAVVMQMMIRDLLTYTRVSTATQAGQPLELADVVNHVLSILYAEITQSEAEITVDAPDSVMFDSGQLVLLLQNLLQNSLMHCDPARAPRITVTSEPLPDGKVKVIVADNGLGIPVEKRDDVFTLFTRLHSSNVGTGVGLAIVKRIVELNGGTIQVDPKTELGTTMVFTLPRAVQPK